MSRALMWQGFGTICALAAIKRSLMEKAIHVKRVSEDGNGYAAAS
jgi:hypothetical protein